LIRQQQLIRFISRVASSVQRGPGGERLERFPRPDARANLNLPLERKLDYSALLIPV
jgi:hypothetical protein